jgi:hypothetical protein
MPDPPILFDLTTLITANLLIMQFSPLSHYCLQFGPKYAPQHPVLNNTIRLVLPLMCKTKFHTHE